MLSLFASGLILRKNGMNMMGLEILQCASPAQPENAIGEKYDFEINGARGSTQRNLGAESQAIITYCLPTQRGIVEAMRPSPRKCGRRTRMSPVVLGRKLVFSGLVSKTQLR